MMIVVGVAALGIALAANALRPPPPAPAPPPEVPANERFLSEMRACTDAELRDTFDRLFQAYVRGQCSVEFEACLCAIVERGSDAWRNALSDALGLLHAITGAHDPGDAIGDRELFARIPSMGEDDLATFGVQRGRISREAQESLIARWRASRRFIVVQER